MQEADHRKGKGRQDMAPIGPIDGPRNAGTLCCFPQRDARYAALDRGVSGASRQWGVVGVRRYASRRVTRRGIRRGGLGNNGWWMSWQER